MTIVAKVIVTIYPKVCSNYVRLLGGGEPLARWASKNLTRLHLAGLTF